MSNKKLVFINYTSRSGSTYLCSLLNKYQSISVGIEAGFPGFPLTLMPNDTPVLNNDREFDQYFHALTSDIRFTAWNIDHNALSDMIRGDGYPINFNKILLSCLQLYFMDKPDTQYWAHKSGYYLESMKNARALFPGTKHIFIVRDPRAVFNSQLEAMSLYSTKNMGADINSFVLLYKLRTKGIISEVNCDDFHLVFYEELLNDENKEMDKIINFIGLKDFAKDEDKNYSENIPDNQQSLHTNVGKQSNTSHIDKWKHKLKPYQIQFIQKHLKAEMEYLNYPIDNDIKLTFNDRIKLLQLNLRQLKYTLVARLKNRAN